MELQALPDNTKKQIRAVLAKMETIYQVPAEMKNQKEKFLNEIALNMDSSDMDWSVELISGELDVWNEKILVAQTGAEVAQTGAEVEKSSTYTVTKSWEILKDSLTLDKAIQAAQKLSQKLSTLSWGKTPQELIPDYAAKLAQTRDDLVRQGQDPKLAEWALLVAEHENVVRKILESPAGKKLDARDLADLQADFAGLRNMLPREAQPKTPADIALADPKVTLEAYTKIKAGFEPPSQPVYSDPKTGEMVSPSAPLTGERTVMTRDGSRYREKDGLRIPSPVPSAREADALLQNLAANRQELGQRERLTQVMSRVTQGEIREKFPWLRLPELDTGNPESLRKQLAAFFSGPEYRKLGENPESRAERNTLEQRLKQLYLSVTWQTQLTKNIKTTESENPEEIVRARIAAQDRTIDNNLSRLSRLGMGAMGQEKYEKVRDTVNKKLKAESNPPIDDRAPITENQGELLKNALLKLSGMSEAKMYPDGTISPEARIRLANLDIRTIEATLLETPVADVPASVTI